MYVDDVFVLVPENLAEEALELLKLVLSEMLGWELDESKSATGKDSVILGARFVFKAQGIHVSIPDAKRNAWHDEIQRIIYENWLTQSQAEQWSGRLQWASCHIFLRCARAALRPIIRRQQHTSSDLTLTGALRQALFWFTSLLAGEVSRWIDFSSLRKKLPYDLVVYSDATGDGRCAAVSCWPDGSVTFCRQHFPNNRRKRLAIRSTQVVAYQLWAAAMAILTFVLP